MLSSIASFLPSALHLNNNTTQEYQQVGPTINPDTEDEDDDVPRNYVQQQQQQQQQQEESTTEGNGQPQGAKGAAKSAYEVGVFLVLVFVLFFGGGRRVGMLDRVRVGATSRRRDATTTDNRFVRSFVLFPLGFMEPLSSLLDSLDQSGFTHRPKVASCSVGTRTPHSTLSSHRGSRPIPTLRTCQSLCLIVPFRL